MKDCTKLAISVVFSAILITIAGCSSSATSEPVDLTSKLEAINAKLDAVNNVAVAANATAQTAVDTANTAVEITDQFDVKLDRAFERSMMK